MRKQSRKLPDRVILNRQRRQKRRPCAVVLVAPTILSSVPFRNGASMQRTCADSEVLQ
jgi:hypothetical protein